jgi:hypothetical protein
MLIEGMDNEENHSPAGDQIKRRPGNLRVSRTRLVMGLLLIVALAIFINLANRAVHENADALRQILGQ